MLSVSILSSGYSFENPPTYTTRPQVIQVQFSADVSASLSASDLRLEAVTGSEPDPIATDVAWDASSNTATFSLASASTLAVLADGNYRATISQADVSDGAGATLSSDVIVDFFVLTGDANHDRSVNVVDLGILSSNWQGTGKTFSQGDFNYDTAVTIVDLGMQSSNWQVTLPAAPTAPDQLTVGNQTTSSIELNWLDSQPLAQGYRIQRSTDGENFTILTTLSRSDPSLTINNGHASWTDTGLPDGTRVWYRVRAYDGGTAYDSAYTPKQAQNTLMIAPTLTATAATAHNVALSWTTTSTTTTGYKVFRSPHNQTSWTLVQTLGSVSSYTDTAPASATTYDYYIQAINATTESAVSSTQSATTLSIAQDMVAEVNAMISGKMPSQSPNNDTLDIFSTLDDSTGTYVRNSNLWASNIDLSCIPVSNNIFRGSYNGCLITPRTLIQVNHAYTDQNDVLTFVSNSGAKYTAYVTKAEQVGQLDLQVITLDHDLPSDIKPAKIFSQQTLTQLSQVSTELPVAMANQFRTLRIGDLYSVGAASASIVVNRPSLVNANSQYDAWYSPVVEFDSGSPSLAFVDNEPVLLTTWNTSNKVNSSQGLSTSYYQNAISAKLAPGQQLSTIAG